MSILFSRQCEYALQAILYLALKPDHEKTSIKELTKRLDLPYHFVAKILQDLRKKGLLTSVKGSAGGFALAMPPEAISLLRIVEAVDGPAFVQGCVLGFPECTGENPCSMHDRWSKIREEIYESLATKSISDMAVGMKKPHYPSTENNT